MPAASTLKPLVTPQSNMVADVASLRRVGRRHRNHFDACYKLKRKDGQLIEIERFFPSSKTCSCCGHVLDELTLDIREWNCPSCGTHHDRDGNAALNIRNEGIRILSMGGGNPALADRGCVRPPA